MKNDYTVIFNTKFQNFENLPAFLIVCFVICVYANKVISVSSIVAGPQRPRRSLLSDEIYTEHIQLIVHSSDQVQFWHVRSHDHLIFHEFSVCFSSARHHNSP